MAEWKDKPTKREQDERDLLFLKSAGEVLSRRFTDKGIPDGMSHHEVCQHKLDALLLRLLRGYISDIEFLLKSKDYGKEKYLGSK